jgi:hypothetical protein
MKFYVMHDKWGSDKDKLWINSIVQTFIPVVDYSHIICLANIYFKISHTYPKYYIIIGTTKESLLLKSRHSDCEAWCCLASKSVWFKDYKDSRSSKLSDTKMLIFPGDNCDTEAKKLAGLNFPKTNIFTSHGNIVVIVQGIS